MTENKKEVVKEDNVLETLSISGFVLGVLSILFMGAQGIIMAIVGLIFSGYSYNKNKTKTSFVGLILNIIGLVIGLILMILLIFFADEIIQTQPSI